MNRVLLAVVLICIIAPTALATISNETCYNQCAAWKFYFQNDICWAWFQEQCVMDEEGALDTAVSFVMDMSEGTAGIDTIVNAFHCAGLIEGCLAPTLKTCRQNCAERSGRYAPNLDVIETFYGRNNPGLFYNEDEKKLYLVVTNDGLTYAKPTNVYLERGATTNPDKKITNWYGFYSTTLPGLMPMAATIQPVGSKNTWEATVPFEPYPDQYNEVRIVIDDPNLIEEASEGDNVYTEVIDLLPRPASLRVEKITKTMDDSDTGTASVSIKVKNDGDVSSLFGVDIYRDSVKPGNLVTGAGGVIAGHSEETKTFAIDLRNVSGSSHGTFHGYYAVLTDKDQQEVDRSWFYLTSYAGYVDGHVVDALGRPLKGAQVCLSDWNICVTTNDNGRYVINNIRSMAQFMLTVSHPSIDTTASTGVTFSFAGEATRSQPGLEHEDVDFILGSTPGTLTIDCPGANGEMDYFVSSTDYAYSGSSQVPVHVSGMMPGSYTISLIKRGVATKTGTVNVAAGADASVQLDCSGTSPQAGQDYMVTAPTLAWNATVEGLPGAVAIARNGKVIVAYTRVPGKFDKSKLYAFDNEGKQLWMITLPSTKGQDRTWVGTSDDGKRTLLCVVEPETTMARIYDDTGHEVANADMGDHSASVCVFSSDGQYAYAAGLRDGMLKEISGGDVTNREGSAEGFFTQDAEFFDEALRPNMVLSSCDGGLCEMSFDRKVQRTFESDSPVVASQTALRYKTAIATKDTINYYDGTDKSWSVPIDDYPNKLSISPAGGFVALMQHNPMMAFKVFANGKDVTPPYKISMTAFNFRFTDLGLYAVTGKTNLLNLYVFGKPTEKPGKEDGKIDGKTDQTKPGTTGPKPTVGEKPTAEHAEKPGIISTIINWFKSLFGAGS